MAASLEKIRAALDSPDPRVRAAAMQHAVALGAKGRPLAVRIAQAITDADESVAWHVVQAFRAAGRGAGEALDVLLPLLDDAVPMRVTRALACIQALGPAGRPALARLIQLASNDALEAIAGLAGTEPDDALVGPLVAGLLSNDYSRSSGVARALTRAPEWLVVRALDAVDARGSVKGEGATLLSDVAPFFPERATASIERALAKGGVAASLAMLAIDRLPKPVPEALVRAVLTAAGNGDTTAAEVLAKLGPKLKRGAWAKDAVAQLAPRLEREKNFRAAGTLGQALGALAPKSGAGVRALLHHFADGPKGKGRGGSWYGFGALAEAMGALADPKTAPAVEQALRAVLDRSEALLEIDDSAGLDLQRSLKSGLAALGVPAKKVTADAVDAAHAREDRRAAKQTLAPIPKAKAPAKAATARAPTVADRKHVRAAIDRGRVYAGVTARTPPKRVAAAVDRAVVLMQRTRERDPRKASDLGALYGDALVRGLGWEWAVAVTRRRVEHAVVSPQNGQAVLPVVEVVRAVRPGAEVTLALTYNLLAE